MTLLRTSTSKAQRFALRAECRSTRRSVRLTIFRRYLILGVWPTIRASSTAFHSHHLTISVSISAAIVPRSRLASLTVQQTSRGSFSAVSKPNFARKYSLESSRRDLHNAFLCTVVNSQNFVKFFIFLNCLQMLPEFC